jgi:hypothetical protein
MTTSTRPSFINTHIAFYPFTQPRQRVNPEKKISVISTLQWVFTEVESAVVYGDGIVEILSDWSLIKK